MDEIPALHRHIASLPLAARRHALRAMWLAKTRFGRRAGFGLDEIMALGREGFQRVSHLFHISHISLQLFKRPNVQLTGNCAPN